MNGSMLSRVMEPPLGISKILMFASTVPRAIIRAHSTRVRVLESTAAQPRNTAKIASSVYPTDPWCASACSRPFHKKPRNAGT